MKLSRKPIKKDYVTSQAHAKKYSSGREPYAKEYYKDIVKYGHISKETEMIDICCGTGNLSSLINEISFPKHIYMVDINRVMLDEAQEICLSDNFSFHQAPASELRNVIDGKVDVILATNAVQSYVGNQKEFLKNARYKLKYGGKLIFDISTRIGEGNYSKKFRSEWVKEICSLFKKAGYNMDNSRIRQWTAEGFTKNDQRNFVKEAREIGYSVKVRKYKEPWSVDLELKMWTAIPARTDQWLAGVPANERNDLLLSARDSVISRIGSGQMSKCRLFFYLTKK